MIMVDEKRSTPIADMHCDMLHYLATVANASPDDADEIGCAIPHLLKGKVSRQVMAISSVEDRPDADITRRQVSWYKRLLTDYQGIFSQAADTGNTLRAIPPGKVGILPAIENASALCAEPDPLQTAFSMLDTIVSECGKPLYLSLTHHGENRFGGGNQTGIGLKVDGRSLLEYISNKRIAIDLSHTNDKLACDIIDYIDAHGLNLPIVASHSNFRPVYNHPRNLPDELARAVIDRKGLIGINFLRAFVHPDDPNYLAQHIRHGLELGGEDVLALGADYFCTATHPDPSRRPFFFSEHEHAGKYQTILDTLANELDTGILKKIARDNAMRFIDRLSPKAPNGGSPVSKS
jgi:membrane dipeptidase